MSATDTQNDDSSWTLFLSLFCISSDSKSTKSLSDSISTNSRSSSEPEGILLYEGLLMDNGKEIIYENIICEKPEPHPRPTTAPEKACDYRTTEETGSIGGTKLVKSVSSASNRKRLSKSIISNPTDFRHVNTGAQVCAAIPQLPEIPPAVLRQSLGPSLERSISCPQKRLSRRLSYLPGPNQPQMPPVFYQLEMTGRSKSVSGATRPRPRTPQEKVPDIDPMYDPKTARRRSKSVSAAAPDKALAQPETEIVAEFPPVPTNRRRAKSVCAAAPRKVPQQDGNNTDEQVVAYNPERRRRARSVSAATLSTSSERVERVAARPPLPPRLPLKPAIVHKRWTSNPSLSGSNRSTPSPCELEHQRSFSSQSFHFPRKPSTGSLHDAATHKPTQPGRHRRTRSCTAVDMDAFKKQIGPIKIMPLEISDSPNKRQGIYCLDDPPARTIKSKASKLDKMPPIPGSPHAATLLNSYITDPQPKRPRPQTLSTVPHAYRRKQQTTYDELPSQRKRQSLCDTSDWRNGPGYLIDLDAALPPQPSRNTYCAPRNLTGRMNRMSVPSGGIGIAV